MLSVKSIVKTCLAVALLTGSLSNLSFAVVNRKDMVDQIRGINADFNSGHVSVWINENASDPGVNLGDELRFNITSNTPKHFLMILVDPKGQSVVVLPDGLDAQSIARTSYTYPPIGTGTLTQGEPVGLETVFVVASDVAVSKDQLKMHNESDMVSLEGSLDGIGEFVRLLNTISQDNPLSIVRYEYFVDANVQYGTRAVRRELAARVQQVDSLADNQGQLAIEKTGDSLESKIESESLSVSDIKFESNSVTLTSTGSLQLDVFGSELVSLWDSIGLPTIILEGHTDDIGSASYNHKLSELRAEAAKMSLVNEFGLPSNKIITRGMGEIHPLVQNVNAEARANNRRVEIAVSN